MYLLSWLCMRGMERDGVCPPQFLFTVWNMYRKYIDKYLIMEMYFQNAIKIGKFVHPWFVLTDLFNVIYDYNTLKSNCRDHILDLYTFMALQMSLGALHQLWNLKLCSELLGLRSLLNVFIACLTMIQNPMDEFIAPLRITNVQCMSPKPNQTLESVTISVNSILTSPSSVWNSLGFHNCLNG